MKIALILLLVLLLAAILIEYRHNILGFFEKKKQLSNFEIYEKELLIFFNYKPDFNFDQIALLTYSPTQFHSKQLRVKQFYHLDNSVQLAKEESEYLFSKYYDVPFVKVRVWYKPAEIIYNEIMIHLNFWEPRRILTESWLSKNKEWTNEELQDKLLALEELNEMVNLQNLKYKEDLQKCIEIKRKFKEDEEWDLFEQKMLYQMKGRRGSGD
ncbi:hypothetical protein N9E11_01625 [Crocinitomicaceae bacterium]|nr:hypothetical protein [Crocinitomicaceae bacterium]